MSLKNPLNLERLDEPIALSRAWVENKLGVLDANTIVELNHGKKIIPSQEDDLDGDGKWDELFFVYSFQPKEKVKLSLKKASRSQLPAAERRTNIRMAKVIVKGKEYEEVERAKRLPGTETANTQKYFQFEGPGWENDKVGFRNYFDERNGMDIFGKTTAKMVMDTLVVISCIYHVLSDWGMDILKVCNSLGSGALAIWDADQLHRVTAPDHAYFQRIAEGPLRSVFDLTFEKMTIGGREIALKHRITITAGQYYYQSDVSISGGDPNWQLAPGIVNLQSDQVFEKLAKKQAVLYTHDKQSFDNEYLGMALLMDAKDYSGLIETPDKGEGVVSTYVAKLKNIANASFRFYACWELTDAAFKDRAYFENFLTNEALKKGKGIKVK